MPSTTTVKSEDERSLLEAVGRHVRQRRLGLGFTQANLAELAGLTTVYVSHFERGRTNISLLNLRRLAEALNCSMRDLLHDA